MYQISLISTYVGSSFEDIFGILIVGAVEIGFVIFSSWIVGLVFLIGAEADRSCEIVFVDEELNLADFTCRASIVVDDDDVGFETPDRSLLLLFVDVCDWVVLGLYGNTDDGVLLPVGLTDSFEDGFGCWIALGIWEVFEDEIRGFLGNDDGIDFGSVLIEIDFVSGSFFFSSLVEGVKLVFLIDWITVEFVDWVLGLVIGIVIVNFDCLVSLVDDEIGLVFVEIFLTSVLVGDDNEFIFLGITDDDVVDFFGVIVGRGFVLVLL